MVYEFGIGVWGLRFVGHLRFQASAVFRPPMRGVLIPGLESICLLLFFGLRISIVGLWYVLKPNHAA